jgi:hypothetical protein
VLLQLTGKGQQLAQRVAAARGAKFRTVASRIDKTEFDSVMHALAILAKAMDERASPSGKWIPD